ncbi:MAG TPA: UDP-N-acetylglucosamine--N-acetylmuramyl-(pentapeptide) pyrophosphoryl-undecaprenol N-acetylglucosamine transferase, partial [candidate division Zixibacteria bacterium]|nr:UDP-N-acetylglucosamine--N-acetylmuramyl-(pentapeptide) pyrophosphoryl-undecaprenol N-acetylglucosamine transferase [candidate division Zixibacteria bacterium]
TRISSLFATRICLGLPGAKSHLWRKSRAELTGNPVEIPAEMPEVSDVRRRLGLEPDMLTILVTGGSQGAESINRAIIELIEKNGLPEKVQMLWQTGQSKFDDVRDALGDVPKNVVLKPFIRPMWEAYRSADIVVARCGALTLSEISIFGLPGILVPYPFAAADHQRLNALSFAKAGASMVLSDEEISGNSLAKALQELIKDEKKREKMARASRELGRPSALNEIVITIEKILEEK